MLEEVLYSLLFVLAEGCRWRAIHRPGLSWITVYKYWRRWCQSGLWEKFLTQWNKHHSGDIAWVDSTCVKVHKSATNAQGEAAAQAIGRTKGGPNTKIHVAVDHHGQPISLLLSAGNEADVTYAEPLLVDGDCKVVVADKGYDSDLLRDWLRSQGMEPCIPPRSNRRTPEAYSFEHYRKRHLVENYFEKIKWFRRVATRYDKLYETYFGFVCLAAAILAKS